MVIICISHSIVTASSNVSKPFICLDSAPLTIGSGKGGSNSGEEGSPPHSSDDPGLLETSVSPPQSNMVLRKRIRKIKQGMKRYNSQLTLMRRDLRSCKTKIAEQQKQIVEYATRLDENDKKNEETSRKFSTLLQVLTKIDLVICILILPRIMHNKRISVLTCKIHSVMYIFNKNY